MSIPLNKIAEIHAFDLQHARLFGMPAAVILSHFDYVTGVYQNTPSQRRRLRGGKWWICKSVRQLKEKRFHYLGLEQIRGALDKLVKKRVLCRCQNFNRPGDKTYEYAFLEKPEKLGPAIKFNSVHASEFGLPEAVLILNFSYWLLSNKVAGKAPNEGKFWHYTSYNDLAECLPFSESTLKRVLSKLILLGVLIQKCFDSDARRRRQSFAFVDEERFLQPYCPETFAKVKNPRREVKLPNGKANTRNADLKTPNDENCIAFAKSRLATKPKSYSSNEVVEVVVEGAERTLSSPVENHEVEALAHAPNGNMRPAMSLRDKDAFGGGQKMTFGHLPITIDVRGDVSASGAIPLNVHSIRDEGNLPSPVAYQPFDLKWKQKETVTSVRNSYRECHEYAFGCTPQAGLGRASVILNSANALGISGRLYMLILMLLHATSDGRAQGYSMDGRIPFTLNQLYGKQSFSAVNEIGKWARRNFATFDMRSVLMVFRKKMDDPRTVQLLSRDGSEMLAEPYEAPIHVKGLKPGELFLKQWCREYHQYYSEDYNVSAEDEKILGSCPSHPHEIESWIDIAVSHWESGEYPHSSSIAGFFHSTRRFVFQVL